MKITPEPPSCKNEGCSFPFLINHLVSKAGSEIYCCFKLLPTSHQVGHYLIHQEKYLPENDDSSRVFGSCISKEILLQK